MRKFRHANLALVSYFLALALALAPSMVRAEYRAFKLAILNQVTGTVRAVTSTLDPLQFPDYHPLQKDEAVSMTSTWMCWKRSDQFSPICPQPLPQAQPPAIN